MENLEKKGFELSKELEKMGVEPSIVEKYSKLINNIKFVNINPESESGKIHLKMIGSLFSTVENDKIFLKNIIKSIELEDLAHVDISNYLSDVNLDFVESVGAENIDLDIGLNRRVNKIDCYLKSGEQVSFTLSTDLRNVGDDESNSAQEKLIFESPIGRDNPVLQKYLGYLEKDFDGKNMRFIAKEYLPGKNITHYVNNLENESESLLNISDVSSDLAYSIAYLYKRGEAELLSDLKLENIIYNYEKADKCEYPCRACDNSGFYEDQAKRKSIFQVLAHLQSLLLVFNNKKNQIIREKGSVEFDVKQEEVLDSYLDSFLSNLDKDSLLIFKNNINEILLNQNDKDIFEIDQEIVEYVKSFSDLYD
jgi:hypothetical protein